MELSQAAITKLLKELKDLQTNAIDGVKVLMNEDNIADVQAEYEGPGGTPYEGGLFRMKLVVGSDFPNAPPKEPNPESALNEEAGKLLLEAYDDFAKHARLMTSIHARKPSVLTAAGGANAVNADGLQGAACDAKSQQTASSSKAKGLPAKGLDKKRSLKRL